MYLMNLKTHEENTAKLMRQRGILAEAMLTGAIDEDARKYLLKYMAEPLKNGGTIG